ncbi:hypothetical protein BT96DRAFT_830084 [Gymnopus androsaceus JB14]|uniref:GSKIP domain-containing protein n=1 Tax=Gymnopus androsaceus JB14 TaxID=1447944 RepID=A0A6A4H691_9AGAR|nr:hypothetical protein BT96DRAFT_830084 [Gymnopus androsaceus JB14]
MNPSQFHVDELQRALSEQAIAIRSFSVIDSSSLQATASVTLLEGNDITIKLTNRGYQSVSMLARQADDIIFETIEDLLRSVSPLYAQKSHALLLQALEGCHPMIHERFRGSGNAERYFGIREEIFEERTCTVFLSIHLCMYLFLYI